MIKNKHTISAPILNEIKKSKQNNPLWNPLHDKEIQELVQENDTFQSTRRTPTPGKFFKRNTPLYTAYSNLLQTEKKKHRTLLSKDTKSFDAITDSQAMQNMFNDPPGHLEIFPLDNTIESDVPVLHSDIETDLQTLLKQSTPTPSHTELFFFTNQMFRRIMGRSLPPSVYRNQEFHEKELNLLISNHSLVETICSIQNLSFQFKETAQVALSHRKELGRVLFRIEVTYLKLFEKLLQSVLTMYWDYKKNIREELNENHKQIDELKHTISDLEETSRTLSYLVEGREIENKTYRVSMASLEEQIKGLQHYEKELRKEREVNKELKQFRFDYHEKVENILKREEEIQIREEKMKLEITRMKEEFAMEKHQILDEARKIVQTKQEAIYIPIPSKPIPKQDGSSQTEINDDGLWDLQDGIPINVSVNTVSRIMWKRLSLFVKCRNCKGRPFPKSRSKYDPMDELIGEYSEIETKVKKTKPVEWFIPRDIRIFLANLPRSIQASEIYPLVWLVGQIEDVYDAKYPADISDAKEGVPADTLSSFISEFYLKKYGIRQKAEVELFYLLLSIKHYRSSSPLVQMFARFMNLIQDTSQAQKSTIKGAGDKAKATKEELNSAGVSSIRSLSQSYFYVYLHARYDLLYKKLQDYNIKHPKSGTSKKVDNSHVICVDQIKKWIPLDHCLLVIKHYLGFLPESRLHVYCRQLEYNCAFYKDNQIIETKGNRLAVRAEMRQAMLANETNVNNESLSFSSEKVVVDLDKVLETIVEVFQLKSKTLEDELVRLFDKGDINHDCVLSFDEFSMIIRTERPDFTERKLLRMFREALTLGDKQSFSIEMDTFIKVCTNHGLVSLLSENVLKERRIILPRKNEDELNQVPAVLMSNLAPLINQTKSSKSFTQQIQMRERKIGKRASLEQSSESIKGNSIIKDSLSTFNFEKDGDSEDETEKKVNSTETKKRRSIRMRKVSTLKPLKEQEGDEKLPPIIVGNKDIAIQELLLTVGDENTTYRSKQVTETEDGGDSTTGW